MLIRASLKVAEGDSLLKRGTNNDSSCFLDSHVSSVLDTNKCKNIFSKSEASLKSRREIAGYVVAAADYTLEERYYIQSNMDV